MADGEVNRQMQVYFSVTISKACPKKLQSKFASELEPANSTDQLFYN
jgi:hypothetical protein